MSEKNKARRTVLRHGMGISKYAIGSDKSLKSRNEAKKKERNADSLACGLTSVRLSFDTLQRSVFTRIAPHQRSPLTNWPTPVINPESAS